MKAAEFDYVKPQRMQDAISSLSARDGNAKIMSGGCSLGPMLNLRLARPALIVDVRGLVELRRISRNENGLVVGAGWTHAEIEDGVIPDVTRGFLKRVASGIAHRAVRNRGTIGGSLAHADPAADWISALMALDAKLLIQSGETVRRSDVASFMIAPYTTDLADDDVLVAIEVPALSDEASWSYHKICRKVGEFAHAIGTIVVDRKRNVCRVVCGAIEAPPILLPNTAADLLAHGTKQATAVMRGEVEQLLSGHDDVFRQLHRVALERAIKELVE